MIEEVQTSPKPIILFIDEAHTLIGAGGAGMMERFMQMQPQRLEDLIAAHAL